MSATASGRGWTMYLGDCRALLAEVGAVDHVVTDPPYGTRTYATDRDDGAVSAVLRSLECSGALAIFGYAEVLVRWCLEIGRVPDEWVTWWPTNHAAKAGGRAKGLPKWTEHVAIFGATPGAEALRSPRAKRSADKPQNAHLPPDARIGDVWTDASPGIAFNAAARLHPNEKPVATLLKLVRLVSGAAGELVLDPFAGSGTTGVAALRLGRRFVGVELDATHFETACARLRAEEAGSTVAASRAGQAALFGGSR